MTVKVDAADADSGIGDVALFIDGDYVASSTSSASPYEFSWHTGDLAPGAHKLKAIVADKLDNRDRDRERHDRAHRRTADHDDLL